MVEKFEELDKDNSGKLDKEEAKAGLKAVTMGEWTEQGSCNGGLVMLAST